MIQSGTWIVRLMMLSALCMAVPSIEAQTLRTTDVPFRPDIRALGMGGAYLAAGRNGSAFLYNPALLVQSHADVGIPFSFGTDQNAIDLFKFINDNKDSLSKFADLTSAGQQKLYDGITPFDGEKTRLRISPMFNIVMRNFGISAYGLVRAGVGIDKGIFEPRIQADGRSDIVVTIGAANYITPKLAIGGNAKIVNSRFTSFDVRVTKAGDTFKTVQDSLRKSNSGYAADVGALYRLTPKTSLGFVIQNIYGKVGNETFPVNVKAGIAWRSNRLTLAADLTDILNKDGVALFNRVFMGGELSLPLIQIRSGFYQGYLSFGAGLNLKLIKLDYAFYKQEFSRRPGLDGRGQHEVQVKIGWGW
ncbi:MAG: hypothetical protein VX603_01000 [Gemmatimonadota bacterium]|nr:hypothetical protein [Gemmatimonadota bacterium]